MDYMGDEPILFADDPIKHAMRYTFVLDLDRWGIDLIGSESGAIQVQLQFGTNNTFPGQTIAWGDAGMLFSSFTA